MAPAPIAIEVSYGGTTAHVVCAGEIDVSSVATLEGALDVVFSRDPRTIMFDGAAVDVLAGVGAEILVEAAKKCRARGMDFELTLNDRGWRVLDLWHVRPLIRQEETGDYEVPWEVADALTAATVPEVATPCEPARLGGAAKGRVIDQHVW